MAFNTVIQQGRFTSDGTNKIITIRSDVDWMYVYNETILNDNALAADRGAWFYWQRGMTNGRGLEYQKLGTVANDPITTLQIAANAGFFLYDNTGTPELAKDGVTAITNAVQPVCTVDNTTGSLVTGSIVRLSADTDDTNIIGFDFEVDTVVANTSFRMRYALANAPGQAGAGDGFYRHIQFDPIFYPRYRYIVNITQAAQAVVTLSVTHGYQVGQVVSFTLPSVFGMVEMDGLQGTITAISTANNTITVDIDSSAFTAFVFPAAADAPFTWAQTTPVGEDTAQALSSAVDILTDATYNTGQIGMLLVAGDDSPAGADGDVIYWVAGKSFSVDNQ
jgi:hypothetical protein